MRILNKNEQDLCLRILKGDGMNNTLSNLIDHKLEDVRISVKRTPPNVDLLFTIQNQQPTDKESEMVSKRIQEISKEILIVVNLINLLEKEGYIMLLQRANQFDQPPFGRGESNMPDIKHNFPDQRISALLIEYTAKDIYATEEFKEFCKQNFIARDEQHFRRQICVTKVALIVTIIASVLNIIFSLVNIFFTGEVKIKQEQIDSIRIDLKSINSNIDTVNEKTRQATIKILEELKKKNEIKPNKKK